MTSGNARILHLQSYTSPTPPAVLNDTLDAVLHKVTAARYAIRLDISIWRA